MPWRCGAKIVLQCCSSASCLLQGIRFRLQLVRTEHMGWGILSWCADSCAYGPVQ